MPGFLVVIREVILQCTPEAAVPCRKVVAADVVAETPTQPTELHDRKKRPSWKGWVMVLVGAGGAAIVWAPGDLRELPNLDTLLGLLPSISEVD